MKKIAYSLILIAIAVLLQTSVLPKDASAKYVSQDSMTLTINVEMPQYTVVFDANSGTGTMNPQTITYGTSVALSKNIFEREDYVFLNWNTDPNGGGMTYTDEEVIGIQNALRDSPGSVTLYAQWEYSPMPIVFEQNGVCEFHGEVNGVPQPITGDGCDYAGRTYIDTGWQLYSQDNYLKDFEIGFKIVEYNYSQNVDQATFATDKYESGSTNSNNPGFVIRKGTNGNIEITQMINVNQKAAVSFPASSVTEVKLARVDEKVYYSINGGNYVLLQSNVGTSDYHELPMWFGAAPTNQLDENGNYIPHRYLVGKLSDIYIRVGNFDSFKHIVTFHANGEGATVNPTEKVYLGDSTMGSVPVPERAGHAFLGWYTEPEGGTRIREDTSVTGDMDLYAHWSDDANICEVVVNGSVIGRGESLTSCIATAGTSASATIKLLADTHDNVTIGIGQDITFDLGDNVWSDRTNVAVISNEGGKVHIISGTITSTRTEAVINNKVKNNVAPELYISGGSIIATGSKQAVYNEGGYVEISGDAYLSSTSMNRATVQNKSNGNMVILSGTIESKGFSGVLNESSAQSLVIGTQGNGILTTPVIRGIAYGIETSANIEFYDGVLKGISGAINNPSRIGDRHDGTLTDGTEDIDGTTYHTLYNE